MDVDVPISAIHRSIVQQEDRIMIAVLLGHRILQCTISVCFLVYSNAPVEPIQLCRCPISRCPCWLHLGMHGVGTSCCTIQVRRTFPQAVCQGFSSSVDFFPADSLKPWKQQNAVQSVAKTRHVLQSKLRELRVPVFLRFVKARSSMALPKKLRKKLWNMYIP